LCAVLPDCCGCVLEAALLPVPLVALVALLLLVLVVVVPFTAFVLLLLVELVDVVLVCVWILGSRPFCCDEVDTC